MHLVITVALADSEDTVNDAKHGVQEGFSVETSHNFPDPLAVNSSSQHSMLILCTISLCVVSINIVGILSLLRLVIVPVPWVIYLWASLESYISPFSIFSFPARIDGLQFLLSRFFVRCSLLTLPLLSSRRFLYVQSAPAARSKMWQNMVWLFCSVFFSFESVPSYDIFRSSAIPNKSDYELCLKRSTYPCIIFVCPGFICTIICIWHVITLFSSICTFGVSKGHRHLVHRYYIVYSSLVLWRFSKLLL